MAWTDNAWVAMVWKGQGDDSRLFRSVSEDGDRWSEQHLAGLDRGTSHGPALASGHGTPFLGDQTVAMAWKGIADDPGVYWSSCERGSWTPQQHIQNAGFATTHGPAVAAVNGELMLAFRRSGSILQEEPGFHHVVAHGIGAGPFDGARLAWSMSDGSTWREPAYVGAEEVRSSHGPALAASGRQAVMAWKGAGDDGRIYWSFFDGRSWSQDQLVPGVGTSDRPALVWSGSVYMAWKGLGDDPKLYWSTLHNGSWARQQAVADGAVGSSHGPALAVVRGTLIMAWKGVREDPRIFRSLLRDGSWSDQLQIAGGTSHGPALASFTVLDL